ncbi:MAG: phage major capsid protein [Paracoccus sp. (in: a-proteobacteria)]|nr:phage major capsid protein [Paracoccus sp. (in: a-proteobacteria)]
MTEIKQAGAGSPGELKGALLGFVDELKGFRQDIQSKLEAQDNRMTMIERKSLRPARAPLAVEAEQAAPHQKAFDAYLRYGDETALRGLEQKGLSTADAGLLASPTMIEQVVRGLGSYGSLRTLARVVTVDSGSYDVLVDTDELETGWATETTVPETAPARTERVNVSLFELAAMPKATQRVLDDAAFDVEEWLAQRIADRFARSEAAAFITGDGFEKPTGILAAERVDDEADALHTNVVERRTGAAGAFSADPCADLIDLVYSVKPEYRANASFVLNSKTAALVRKLRDNDGRFLWTDSLAAGEPSRLLGYPVLLAEDMPDVDAEDPAAIAFGDFAAAYVIAERPELRVLRDPFSAKPHVLFYATKRIGGALVDGRAIKLLKFAA